MDEKDSQKPKGIEHKLKIKGNLQTTHTHTHKRKKKGRETTGKQVLKWLIHTYVSIITLNDWILQSKDIEW